MLEIPSGSDAHTDMLGLDAKVDHRRAKFNSADVSRAWFSLQLNHDLDCPYTQFVLSAHVNLAVNLFRMFRNSEILAGRMVSQNVIDAYKPCKGLIRALDASRLARVL